MNRIIEIVAMVVGGLSLFLVCFVGFAAMSGKDMSQVAVVGKLFPELPVPEETQPAAVARDGGEKGLSDAAVIEASLGVLSAWTLPSPYSASELRVLSEEIQRKRVELDEREEALARRERAVAEDERGLEERRAALEELRARLEQIKIEVAEREVALTRAEGVAQATRDAGWAEVARVIGAIEEPKAAAKKLQEYEPAEAAKILRSLGDDTRAGEILNAVEGARWKDYVAAYTSEKPRTAARGRR